MRKRRRRAQKFSEYFALNKSQYELDFVDVPVNNGDLPLFIDPYAISKRNDRWSIECHNQIVTFFQKVIDHIRQNRKAAAMVMLSGLHEPNQTRFGLSVGSSPRGNGVGPEQAERLYCALAESSAVKTGFIQDLGDCELLIEGVSHDKISDITSNILRNKLIEYTKNECELWNIPMQDVPSGPLWDMQNNLWGEIYTKLPTCHERSVILVPKGIARRIPIFDHREYYQRYVLEYLQEEHLTANSSLVRVLKDGTKKVPTKKSLAEKYPLNKPFLYDFSKDHPEVLKKYKASKSGNIVDITNQEIDSLETQQSEEFDYDNLIVELEAINSGDADASKFHKYIIGALTAIFYPELINPIKEQEIDQGRKRIDIVFENAARSGFFNTLPNIKQVPSAYIVVECKNYSSDPANPELDQLAGRFSTNRGRFGFLICRTFQNKELFFQRCRDTAQNQNGFIIPLDDDDIKELIRLRRDGNFQMLNSFLDQNFRKIVM